MLIKIAHRGFSGIAPENTMAAFQKALEVGVDGVELDVHGTLDRQVVSIHDSTLNRTTNRSGNVNQLTLNQIREADAGSWFSPQFAGEKIPTLAEALDLIGQSAVAVVEIKDTTIVERVVEIIHQANASDHVVVISFDKSALKQIRQLDPRIPTGFLVGSNDETNSMKDPAIELVKQVSTIGAGTLNVQESMVLPTFARQIRKRGINLWTWTVDDLPRMRELVDYGVQGITTNFPQKLAALEH